MSRPTSLLKDATLYWVINLYNTSNALVDADSTPTVAVRKNGAAVVDSVTVTKRSATTGIYDCSYNPSGEVEGDQFTIEETAVISSTTYKRDPWTFRVVVAERGTNSAYTGTPPTIEEIAGEVWSSATRSLTDKSDFALSSAAIDAIEASLVNEGDSTALLQAIADKIAGDLTAGDLTALAIVSAIKADETLAQMIARIDAAVSSRLATESYVAPLNAADTRAAIGLASANLDTQLGEIVTTQSSHTSTLSTISSGVTMLLGRITSTLFQGITSLGQWLGAMAGKQTADATALTEINATGAGSGTFSGGAADSLEAIRDRGDAAWTTGSGGSGSVSISITPLKGQQEQRVIDSDLVGYINDRSSIGTIAVTEDDGITPVDVSAFSANARIWIEPSSGTGTRYEVTPTVSGDDGNLISFTLPAAVVAAKSTWLWSLRDITGASAGEGRHVIGGTLTIKRAARAPA